VTVTLGTLISALAFLAALVAVCVWVSRHHARQYPKDRIVVGERERRGRFGPLTMFTWLSGGRG
jgi:hypothetical protein